MLSHFTIALLLYFAVNGYCLSVSNSTQTSGDIVVKQRLRNVKLPSNDTELEAQKKMDSKRPVEMSSERRMSYNSIRDRRNYFRRREDAIRTRQRQNTPRHDAATAATTGVVVVTDRDVLEPQETAHAAQHTLPKHSVINFDKRIFEFGFKLPKRISTKLSLVEDWGTTALPEEMENLTKLSLVEDWGTTALPEEMENLVMPPDRKREQKMSRLTAHISTIHPDPLPLSMAHQIYPTRIPNNENNKRILSEMNKELHLQVQHTNVTSAPVPTTTSPNPSSSAVTAPSTITSSSAGTEEPTTHRPLVQSSTSTTRPDIPEESLSPPITEIIARYNDSGLWTNQSKETNRSSTEAPDPEPSSTTPTMLETTSVSNPSLIDNQPKTEYEGRGFPTGFNDFHRENEASDSAVGINHDGNRDGVALDSSSTTSTPTSTGPPTPDEQDRPDTSVTPNEANEPADVMLTAQPMSPNGPLSPTNPPYIKVYEISSPETPQDLFYSDISNNSDIGIVLSVSEHQVGLAVYFLAVFGLLPLVLAFVFVAKYLLNRKNQKNECESDASSMDAQPPSSRGRSELHKSPSSATTITLVHATRLPRVPHKCHSWELQRHNLTLLNILGQGNFGQVWKAELEDGSSASPKLVAVKAVKEGATEKEEDEIIKEMQIMQHMGHHPNVVHLIGCCTDKDPYYLVMEYVSNGKLLTYLRDHRTKGTYYNFSNDSDMLTSRDLTVFMFCVARGMEYLVSKRIIHRDLAARNILVDQNKMCKIADFGMSRMTQEDSDGEIYEERQHRGALPIRWMAPESLHYSLFTHKTDVWSFGILMWETFTLGSTPYPNLGAREVVQGVRNGLRLDKPSHVKNDLFRLVSQCWAQDSNLRPNFTELRLHLADLLDGTSVDLDSYALDNRFHLQTRTRNRRSKNTGKGTVTLVGNGSFTVNSRILDSQFSIV